jgi:hypothetical protein
MKMKQGELKEDTNFFPDLTNSRHFIEQLKKDTCHRNLQ